MERKGGTAEADPGIVDFHTSFPAAVKKLLLAVAKNAQRSTAYRYIQSECPETKVHNVTIVEAYRFLGSVERLQA